MRRGFLAVFLLSLVCSGGYAQHPETAGVRTHMLVSTDWLAGNLNDPKLVLLHIGRTRQGYDSGHIPKARFLNYEDLVVTRNEVLNELPPVETLQSLFAGLGISNDSRIVLLCELQGLMAARAYWTLDYLGFGKNAALLDGGFEKWKSEQRETSTTAPEIKAGNFMPELNPGVIVSREIVRDISWLIVNGKPVNTVLLDARSPEAYSGETAFGDLPLNGHIPGAGNVYYMNSLNSKESPTIKSIPDLQKIYQEAGFEPGHKVVTYCWIGMMASHGYFTLKYLGYDAAMYDGSFTEWANSEGTTAATGTNGK